MKRTFASAAVVAAALGIFSLTGQAAAAGKTLNIGWTAWSDAEVVTKLAKKILEERMGYKVKLTLADIAIQYQGVSRGDLDVMLMSWLPDTHQDYYAKVRGKIVDLGSLYTRARLGWVVPDYVPAGQLSSIADLTKADVAKKLKRKIQGIDPGAGLMRLSDEAIKDYGLKRYSLVSASGAAMTAALDRAERRKEWIVVTGWSPHWMFGKWKLRYLKDPKHVLGGLERVNAIARKGLYRDQPEAFEFLTRMHIPLDQLQAAMARANATSYEKAVDEYIKANPKRVDYWVTGKID